LYFYQVAPRLGTISGGIFLSEDEDAMEAPQALGQGLASTMDELAQEQAPSEKTTTTKPRSSQPQKKVSALGKAPWSLRRP
jgi:hypothetical protein